MTLFTNITGRGSDIVLLHGWGLHSGVWASLVEALRAEYRVTLVDLPGHGESPFCMDLSNPEELCRVLHDELPENAIWVGWSMGGLVAMYLALSFPAAVERLIVISGSPCFCQRDDWQPGLAPEIFSEFSNGLDKNAQLAQKQFLALQVTPNANGRSALKQLRAVAASHEPDISALRQGLSLLEKSDLRGELQQLGMPLRFILGAEDRLVNSKTGQQTADALADDGSADFRYEIIEGSGHVPFLDNEQKFLQTFKDCLND